MHQADPARHAAVVARVYAQYLVARFRTFPAAAGQVQRIAANAGDQLSFPQRMLALLDRLIGALKGLDHTTDQAKQQNGRHRDEQPALDHADARDRLRIPDQQQQGLVGEKNPQAGKDRVDQDDLPYRQRMLLGSRLCGVRISWVHVGDS